VKIKSLGFIGGGRITGIILEGLDRKDKRPERVFVSETNPEVLSKLAGRFPQIKTSAGDVKGPAAAAMVFIALHPPAVMASLDGIYMKIEHNSLFIF